MNDTEVFLSALSKGVPGSERLIFCGFPGDPNCAPPNAWRPRAWKVGDLLPINPQSTNGYIAISSFVLSPDRSWRRRTDLFGHGLAIMVDDIGTKVARSVVETAGIVASAVIETSPDNEQHWYFLTPTTDKTLFDATIKAFIEQKLLGNDPGMNGVNRVGRVPGYINGKAAYAGFRVKLLSGRKSLHNRYSLANIKDAFNLKLNPRRKRRHHAPRDAEDRVSMFMVHYRWLLGMDMLKHDRPNAGGWVEMHCPWIEEHTGQADTGAAIAQPSEANEWYGAFQCHHGHCIERTWGDLCEWMSDINIDELEKANECLSNMR